MPDGNITPKSGNRPSAALVLCWLAIVFDGFDLVVFGTVAPALLKDPQWTLTAQQVGQIASYALFGLLIGSLVVGRLADLVGRRKMIVYSLTGFSLGMAVSAVVTDPGLFGLFRFLTGLGLGGLLPTITAMIAELAPPGKRRLYHSLAFTAFPLGGILAATLAIPIIPALGWRAMFWVGAVPLATVLPLLIVALPESGEYQAAKAVRVKSRGSRRQGLTTLFSRGRRTASLLFALAFAFNLLTAYGLLTWLPQIMTQTGYSLGSALTFLLALNVAALVLTPLAGLLADRWGSKPICVTGFLLAAVPLAVLSLAPPRGLAYLCVALAGFGTIGLQVQLNTYVANYYDTVVRGTAAGWALGVGRLGAIAGPLIGGALLSAHVPTQWNFYTFAVASALGAVTLLAVPRLVSSSDGTVQGSPALAPELAGD